MTTPYDLDRVRADLPPTWSQVRYLPETGSTNADLLAAVDGPTGEVLVTGHQTAGRGRLDRLWEEPAGSSLMLSVRLRPAVPPAAWGWLPLLAGIAIFDAVARAAPALPVALKWPNDVLLGADGRKVAGILAEARGEVAVIGMGCNVGQTRAELPVPTATSLLAEGVTPDRTTLLRDLLDGLAAYLRAFTAAGGDAGAAGVYDAYAQRCATVGQEVTVTRAHDVLRGRAVRIGADAGLVVATDTGETTVLAGDVTHVRPTGS